MDLRRILQQDRELDYEMRDAIARSLAADVVAGLVPARLRLAVASRHWPVALIAPEGDNQD
jgi:hypothetical protein